MAGHAKRPRNPSPSEPASSPPRNDVSASDKAAPPLDAEAIEERALDHDLKHLDHDLKKMILALGWMLIAAASLWAIVRVWPVIEWFIRILSPFFIALVVAYLFNPIVNLVQRKFRLGRIGGIVAVAGIIVLLVAGFFGLLVPVLYQQTSNVVQFVKEAGPKAIDRSSNALKGMVGEEDLQLYQTKAKEFIGNLDLRNLIENTDLGALAQKVSNAAPGLTQKGFQAVGGVAQAVGSVFSGVTGFCASVFLALIIAFYYLLDFGAIPGLLRDILPPSIEDRTLDILNKLDVAVGGFLRGQILVCSLVALLATLGLSCVGMYKYALLVGIVAGAANFIPYLGPTMGMMPAVLWALLAHETWPDRLLYLGLVVGVFVLIQTLDGLVFQPRIVGKSSNLHPVVVMAALVIGGQFGVGGMILAVPLACIGRVLFKELWWDAYVAGQNVARVEEEKPQ
jgi:predicted PurR-regulated permease PerM